MTVTPGAMALTRRSGPSVLLSWFAGRFWHAVPDQRDEVSNTMHEGVVVEIVVGTVADGRVAVTDVGEVARSVREGMCEVFSSTLSRRIRRHCVRSEHGAGSVKRMPGRRDVIDQRDEQARVGDFSLAVVGASNASNNSSHCRFYCRTDA